ncbi:MAG: lysophospholipid acyltransferase family protein [Anaerorhabdus sp.]
MTFFQIFKMLFVLPVAWFSAIFVRNKTIEERYKKARNWSMFIINYLGYNLATFGVENIPYGEAVYFVSNHQGTLDPALVVASCPFATAFISKQKNLKLPVFGSWAKTIDVIHFDHTSRKGNISMLRSAAERLKKNRNLLVFPEGTRSKSDKMNPFKEGALQPAYLAKATVIPVTLNNAYCIDDKKDSNKNLGITYGKAFRYEEYKDYNHKEFSDILYSEIKKHIE